MSERKIVLQRIQTLLNTPDGEVFVDELTAAWEPVSLLGETSEATAHKVGLRDALQFIKMLQAGELIPDDG